MEENCKDHQVHHQVQFLAPCRTAQKSNHIWKCSPNSLTPAGSVPWRGYPWVGFYITILFSSGVWNSSSTCPHFLGGNSHLVLELMNRIPFVLNQTRRQVLDMPIMVSGRHFGSEENCEYLVGISFSWCQCQLFALCFASQVPCYLLT